jgi:hypothetical protein
MVAFDDISTKYMCILIVDVIITPKCKALKRSDPYAPTTYAVLLQRGGGGTRGD